jgi:Ras-related protein Rab-11A
MSKEDDYDMIFKVVLIGDSGVGKSNILSRYLKNEFSFDSKATVGVEFGSKKFEINEYKIKAQIWDTAGQERYKSITNAYYKGAKGALLVFDLTRKETFDSVDRWIPDLRKSGDENLTILLIGNKCDLIPDRQVSEEDARKKAELYSKRNFRLIFPYYLKIIFRYCIHGNFCFSVY